MIVVIYMYTLYIYSNIVVIYIYNDMYFFIHGFISIVVGTACFVSAKQLEIYLDGHIRGRQQPRSISPR